MAVFVNNHPSSRMTNHRYREERSGTRAKEFFCPNYGTEEQGNNQAPNVHTPAFKSLGILDQFLALWILIAMVIGMLLGDLVPGIGPALQGGI